MAGSRLVILRPQTLYGLRRNIFGASVANEGLFSALTDVLGADRVEAFTAEEACADELRLARAGALLRGNPDIADLAWMRRRRLGDNAYSLIGLIHTLGPPLTRELIVSTTVAPTQAWDALVCTSPSVQQTVASMFDAQAEHLRHRFAARGTPQPALPVIPLGVDGDAMAAARDRPEARERIRREYGLAEDDVLVLWVGRLSFFEKAFPQPMFRAVSEAAAASGKRAFFAMAGWFPDPERHRLLYTEAAANHAPGLEWRVEDGQDAARVADLWAGADVFLSLVDNIQETFGITPLEAMAAGLPVVGSDWDGYRSTVEHGVQGFLVPTLGGPQGGIGERLSDPHILGVERYETFTGRIAQHTAVHIGKAVEALAALFSSADLRHRMGQAGRARVRSRYAWPVIARQYRELVDELAEVRGVAQPSTGPRVHPSKGDPFSQFRHFATDTLGAETVLKVRPGANLQRVLSGRLDMAFPEHRATPQECARALALLRDGKARTLGELSDHFPSERQAPIALAVVWLAKTGILEWS